MTPRELLEATKSETERTALKRIWRLYELMKEENDK